MWVSNKKALNHLRVVVPPPAIKWDKNYLSNRASYFTVSYTHHPKFLMFRFVALVLNLCRLGAQFHYLMWIIPLNLYWCLAATIMYMGYTTFCLTTGDHMFSL